jgi:hypothetical protein
MIAAEFEHLGVDEALDEAEDVRIRAALDLAEISLIVLGQEIELLYLGQAIGQEFVCQIETSVPNDVFIDRPSNPFRRRNSSGITVEVFFFSNR